MGAESEYKVTLVSAAPPAAQAEEEEAAGDMDDPFAMMGGMGAESEYKVTLVSAAPPAAQAGDEEEEAAGDMDDPFAMMGGMCAESEYEVWGESDTKELVLKQVPNNRTYKGLEYENHGIWKKPFFFVQMADTQFGMLGGGTRGLGE